MQVAKRLIVHALSTGYNVSSLELRNEKKTTQQWRLRLAEDIVLNKIRVYHERVYDSVPSKFWFVMSFSSQRYSKFIVNITSESVFQIRTKECKTRSCICMVILNFLRASRHFNCDTVFAVIVSFLKESVHGFNKIRNASVNTSFQILEFGRLLKVSSSKNINFSFLTFWYIDG